MRALACRLTLLALLAAPAAALGDTRELGDAANPDQMVDVVSASHGHRGRHWVRHDFRASQPWFGQDLYELRLRVSALGATRTRRVVTVKPTGSGDSFTATTADEHGRRLGGATVQKLGDRGLRVEVAKRLLGREVRSYRWTATVVSACRPAEPGALCGGPKRDRVPDSGTIGHRLAPR